MAAPSEIPYLIYSREHNRWWAKANSGYVLDVKDAGRYSKKEADEIVLNACRYAHPMDPPEFAIPDPYAAIESADNWKSLVQDQCENVKECRELLSAYDESDSYAADMIQELIEKVLRHLRDTQEQLKESTAEANTYKALARDGHPQGMK